MAAECAGQHSSSKKMALTPLWPLFPCATWVTAWHTFSSHYLIFMLTLKVLSFALFRSHLVTAPYSQLLQSFVSVPRVRACLQKTYRVTHGKVHDTLPSAFDHSTCWPPPQASPSSSHVRPHAALRHRRVGVCSSPTSCMYEQQWDTTAPSELRRLLKAHLEQSFWAHFFNSWCIAKKRERRLFLMSADSF